VANFLTRIFGSRNQRLLRQYQKVVDRINALEEGLQALDDAALKAKTDEFRQRFEGSARWACGLSTSS
jgi:preprotein translocase subunit SecA